MGEGGGGVKFYPYKNAGRKKFFGGKYMGAHGCLKF